MSLKFQGLRLAGSRGLMVLVTGGFESTFALWSNSTASASPGMSCKLVTCI